MVNLDFLNTVSSGPPSLLCQCSRPGQGCSQARGAYAAGAAAVRRPEEQTFVPSPWYQHLAIVVGCGLLHSGRRGFHPKNHLLDPTQPWITGQGKQDPGTLCLRGSLSGALPSGQERSLRCWRPVVSLTAAARQRGYVISLAEPSGQGGHGLWSSVSNCPSTQFLPAGTGFAMPGAKRLISHDSTRKGGRLLFI